jgi:penicillin-binding protein 2
VSAVLNLDDAEERWSERAGDAYARRLAFFRIVTVVVFLVLLGQLWRLQIIEGPRFRAQADENRVRERVLEPPRGVIYDRHGEQLAANVPSFTVAIVPAGLPDAAQARRQVFEHLSALLGWPGPELERVFAAQRGDAFTPVPVVQAVPFDQAARVEEQQPYLPGVIVLAETQRAYRDGPIFAHVIGYARRITRERYEQLRGDTERGYGPNDRIGEAGLERTFEDVLRGRPGRQRIEVDSSERPVSLLETTPPQPGHSLVLTLDAELQRRVTAILQPHLEAYRTASAIVMDPHSGQILALVDLPSFDNNALAGGMPAEQVQRLLSDPRRPLLNKAVGGAYAPGSTFKIVTAAAALQEGVVTKDTTIECHGALRIPRDFVPGFDVLNDWLPQGHGRQDLVAAMANSCDIYFYQLAGGDPNGTLAGLGNERLARYARAFGLGRPTGIDLPGEAPGTVPDAAWKQRTLGEQWVKGNTFIYGIGQGYLTATPLQMLNVVAAIANGGTLYRPQLVREIRDATGRTVRLFAPEALRRLPIAPEHIQAIREGLRAGLLGPEEQRTPNGARYIGTAYTARDDALEARGITTAGKTGTAESQPDATGTYATHGWFVGYAPADRPQIAVVVFVEHGRGAQEAGERFEEIVRAYFTLPTRERGGR